MHLDKVIKEEREEGQALSILKIYKSENRGRTNKQDWEGMTNKVGGKPREQKGMPKDWIHEHIHI